MSKAVIVVDQVLLLENERFAAHIKVYEVLQSAKFPTGYKVRCALVERESGLLYVLLDNHEPFGFHLHSKLPGNKEFRITVEIKSYEDAIRKFFEEVRKVIHE